MHTLVNGKLRLAAVGLVIAVMAAGCSFGLSENEQSWTGVYATRRPPNAGIELVIKNPTSRVLTHDDWQDACTFNILCEVEYLRQVDVRGSIGARQYYEALDVVATHDYEAVGDIWFALADTYNNGTCLTFTVDAHGKTDWTTHPIDPVGTRHPACTAA